MSTDRYIHRLQLLRAVYGETQAEFANRIGLKFKTWNEYERRRLPPTKTLVLIRERIGPGLTDWLLFGDETTLNKQWFERLRQAEQALSKSEKKQ